MYCHSRDGGNLVIAAVKIGALNDIVKRLLGARWRGDDAQSGQDFRRLVLFPIGTLPLLYRFDIALNFGNGTLAVILAAFMREYLGPHRHRLVAFRRLSASLAQH